MGLLSLAMITEKMLTNENISIDPLNRLQVKDVMQTDFTSINFVQTTLEKQLHLLINNAFLPVVDDEGVFQGLLTRREWIKAFNYVSHNMEKKYIIQAKSPNS